MKVSSIREKAMLTMVSMLRRLFRNALLVTKVVRVMTNSRRYRGDAPTPG
jgi:hypothetical protein